jgi:tetratricopeptide (TPR) repeat protein
VGQLRRASLLPLLIAGCASPLPPASQTPTTSTATFATSTGRVAAAAMAYDTLATDEGPPMSLTGTDGTGLQLTKLEAKAVVEGPLAYTELHLYFHNPEARVREGRFAITLPPGAALSRFAMQDAEGKWMEAEVVEKMAARRAYEDFLHRRQDPALLEQAAGNEFSARVFPIPASGDKHLVIAYSQELASSDASYVLPLRGLPEVGTIDAIARVARADRATLVWDEVTLAQKGWKPDRDFIVPITAPMSAVASGEWIAARVEVPAPASGGEDIPSSLAILVDTSASRALGFSREVDQVGELVAALAQKYGGALSISVAAFDQDVLPIYAGRADGWSADQRKALLARQPLGASDLGVGLAWAASSGMKRLVVLGDGVVTAGAQKEKLVAKVKELGGKGVERVDTILIGGIRDVDAARTWVTAGLPRDGAVIDMAYGTGEAARRLGLAVRSDLAIGVKNASWSWPERAVGVQPGDELVVYARGKSAVATATVEIGGASFEVSGVRTNGLLLSRAAAQAEIARMERDLGAEPDAKKQAAMRDAIVKKSTATRVMSSLTAFLVLETDADYARFNIPRTALADILVVGKDGLAVEHRAAPVVMAQPQIAVDDARDEADGKRKGKDANAGDGHQAGLAKEAKKLELALDGGGAPPADWGGDAPGRAQEGQSDPSAPAPPPPAPRVGARGYDSTGSGSSASAGSANDARPVTETTANITPAPDAVARPEPREELRAEQSRRSDRGEDDEDSGSRDSDEDEEKEKSSPPALDGKLAEVMRKIADKQLDDAMVIALSWHKEQPGDVLGLVALGEALEASGDRGLAARAYGSLIDLFPGRADLRRFAGERLERVGAEGRELAIDTYRRAVEDRPDHMTGHRLLAMALVRAGRLGEAFAALEHGLAQSYPSDRFRGGERILREDAGLVAAAWIATEPKVKSDVTKRLAKLGSKVATEQSLRFVLYWETDANDVDFHIRDAKKNHAWYSHKQLRSGGELYEDVTTGYGPECFTIEGAPKAGPYRLKIHYYSRGPMGYGMGVLEIMRHDGKGKLTFEHRPYIAMNDHAYVDLGSVGDGAARTVQLAR